MSDSSDRPKIAVVSPKSYPGEKEHKNVEIAKGHIEEAARDGVDIVCFPEGYPGPFTGPRNYVAFDELVETTRKNGIHVIAGGLELGPQGRFYTTSWLIGPDGKEIGKYRRTTPAGPLIYDNMFSVPFDLLAWGNELPVFATEHGNIGICICSEMYTPELSRVLALKGAEIIFSPAGKCVPYQWETWATILWARAIENLAYVAYCHHMVDEGGVSGVGAGTRILGPEAILAQSPFGGMLSATVDLERIRLLRGMTEDVTEKGVPDPYRRTQPGLSSGLSFYRHKGAEISRKPDLYGPIVMKEEELESIRARAQKKLGIKIVKKQH